MEVNLTVEALKFMALGMGIVFTFLLIMVGVLKLQASLIAKFFPEKEAPVATKPAPVKTQTATNDSKKIAAIVAAVQHHNNLKG